MQTRRVASTLGARDLAVNVHGLEPLDGLTEDSLIVVDRAAGLYVFDVDGKAYLDSVACNANVALGFSHQGMIETVTSAYRTIPAYNTQHNRSSIDSIVLSEQLQSLAPFDVGKVFFGVGGSDANETAVKVVWAYFKAIGKPRKRKLIARLGSYHGGTIFASALTGNPTAHEFFNLPAERTINVSASDIETAGGPNEDEGAFVDRLIDELEAAIAREGPDEIAAFIAEPFVVSGRLGLPPQGYFARVQDVLARNEIKLIVDEVISGFGRGGEVFAAASFGLRPDLLTTAKAITGGYFPFSATLISEEIASVLMDAARSANVLPHSFTNSGNPIGCKAALKMIDLLIEDGLLEHVNAVAPHFAQRIEALAGIDFVCKPRAIGLAGGFHFRTDNAFERFSPSRNPGAIFRRCALDRGVYVRAIADSACFTPALVITRAEIDDMFDRLEAALRDTAALLST